RTRTYRIALERGDAPVVGTVSATSPVGVALVGRLVGDSATVVRPDGRSRRLTVRAVEPDPSVPA
ncbi:MAG: GreA/GreB family elongation factor, partial [Solirubrobacteraceae bacterium]